MTEYRSRAQMAAYVRVLSSSLGRLGFLPERPESLFGGQCAGTGGCKEISGWISE